MENKDKQIFIENSNDWEIVEFMLNQVYKHNIKNKVDYWEIVHFTLQRLYNRNVTNKKNDITEEWISERIKYILNKI